MIITLHHTDGLSQTFRGSTTSPQIIGVLGFIVLLSTILRLVIQSQTIIGIYDLICTTFITIGFITVVNHKLLLISIQSFNFMIISLNILWLMILHLCANTNYVNKVGEAFFVLVIFEAYLVDCILTDNKWLYRMIDLGFMITGFTYTGMQYFSDVDYGEICILKCLNIRNQMVSSQMTMSLYFARKMYFHLFKVHRFSLLSIHPPIESIHRRPELEETLIIQSLNDDKLTPNQPQ